MVNKKLTFKWFMSNKPRKKNDTKHSTCLHYCTSTIRWIKISVKGFDVLLFSHHSACKSCTYIQPCAAPTCLSSNQCTFGVSWSFLFHSPTWRTISWHSAGVSLFVQCVTHQFFSPTQPLDIVLACSEPLDGSPKIALGFTIQQPSSAGVRSGFFTDWHKSSYPPYSCTFCEECWPYFFEELIGEPTALLHMSWSSHSVYLHGFADWFLSK